MVLPPKTDQAFLREVDEELRRDQLAGFWTNWGIWVGVAVVAALAALAGFLYWQHHNGEAAGVEGEQLQAAYDSLGANNAAAASKPLAELAKSNRDGYRALALFTQADVLLQKDDLKGAAAKLGAIAADTSLAKPFARSRTRSPDLSRVRHAKAAGRRRATSSARGCRRSLARQRR
ncbi:tetratricopeptide repeat protein [Sphingomonas faeni]|uniref:tetratricopeptide repeat protein n=1 Tax=Sphingomonas faeni TaxID=185950 RepID=UPI002780AD83|nr:hypothetical protein [Sphingomonas faeni]